MNETAVGLYVNRMGKIPDQPVSIVLDSTCPDVLAKVLHAVGMEVHQPVAVSPTAAWTARTVNTEISIVAAIAPVTPKSSLFFLVENLEAVCSTVSSLGASIVQSPQVTSWGLRAIFCDDDGRRIILTQREALDAFSTTDEQVTTDDADTSILPAPLSGERLHAIQTHRVGVAVVALGALIVALGIIAITLTKVGTFHQWQAEKLSLVAVGVGIVCSAIGKALCLRDRGQSVAAMWIVAATFLDLTAAAGLFYLSTFDRYKAALIIIYVIIAWISALVFVEYLGEFGQAVGVPRLQKRSRQCSIIMMLTLVTIFLFFAFGIGELILPTSIVRKAVGMLVLTLFGSVVAAFILYLLLLIGGVIGLCRLIRATSPTDQR